MKRAFDMLTNAAQQTVKFGRILKGLVGTFSCPDAVASMLTHLGLPGVANKPLITKDVTIFDPLQDDLCGIALISIGAHQIVNYGQAIQSGQHDQFVAEVVQLAGRAMSIGCTACKIAVRLTALVGHDWNRL